MISTGTTRRTAVITGAAGGFGTCFAHRLASMDYDLVLVDCRPQPLAELAQALFDEYQIAVTARPTDLTDPGSVCELVQELQRSADIEMLINNAGFAHLRPYHEIAATGHLKMIALHVTTPAQLIHGVLPGMLERGCGNIINVSSLGAWLPAGDAQYAATKSYLLTLSQALHEELSDKGIRVQALCPSFVDTGFHNTQEMSRFPRTTIPAALWMNAEDVIDCALRGLDSNLSIVIPGWKNRIASVALRSPYLQPLVSRLVRQT